MCKSLNLIEIKCIELISLTFYRLAMLIYVTDSVSSYVTCPNINV